MPDDISLNKAQIIQRCIKRIEEEYGGEPANLNNLTRQDSIILKLQRACEAAIALAMQTHLLVIMHCYISKTNHGFKAVGNSPPVFCYLMP